MKAILFDSLSYIEGRLQAYSADGADFLTAHHPESPELPKRSNITINLLDERSGKSMNVHARLMAINREHGQWIYRVRWLGIPAIIATKAS